jgi:HAD superfamily phosphatase (TIGR01668 family)
MPEWLASVAARGFAVRFVSNNWHADLGERARDLGFPVVGKAKKPLPFAFRRIARELGLDIGACAVVGDQIFTDILGGGLAGAVTVLVDPLTHADMLHTRILRRLERVIMKGRAPEA